MKEKDNDMSIEISNDYYANDYDDISEKQTNESVDDSDDDAAEIFGYQRISFNYSVVTITRCEMHNSFLYGSIV